MLQSVIVLPVSDVQSVTQYMQLMFICCCNVVIPFMFRFLLSPRTSSGIRTSSSGIPTSSGVRTSVKTHTKMKVALWNFHNA